jgi:hypothetical protein
MHRDSRNITRANVGAWSAGHPAVIASATYCAQPLGAVVVVVVGNGVNTMDWWCAVQVCGDLAHNRLAVFVLRRWHPKAT